MKKYIIFICIIISFPVLITGCANTSKSVQEKTINSNLNFSIITGSGGGVTGISEGYFIDTLGSVSRWKGKTFESAEKVQIGKLNNQLIDELNESIQTNNVLNSEFKEHGNITSFISLTGNKTKYLFSWKGIEPGKEVPENIRSFFTRVKQIINSLQ